MFVGKNLLERVGREGLGRQIDNLRSPPYSREERRQQQYDKQTYRFH